LRQEGHEGLQARVPASGLQAVRALVQEVLAILRKSSYFAPDIDPLYFLTLDRAIFPRFEKFLMA
jgi:hypothetical protein